ncbi:phosphoribosyltransferase [Marivirga tractuosa]|uniref:Phosphoribosyltransferase n=1 Tax=Marivirga tractuosa (strain ATCC 23168 / DSM 4126 / NBRC 15989 / NCIMB 1408 / VKM B-1430 / H-43) TaxID=643867 RepID=E4TPB3_MARTH|nr:phosphoribosyltransferase family protein [Marivirga tractuosa]ADR20516.1 phosphoribosyltransferase [Marivirga tractuosa DSM 4126]BDD15036.1 phosphoribosyltransferase [Marivirga tractuosa]
MLNKSSQILDREAIRSKIKRIAFQVLENNYKEENLYIVGIEGGGAIFGEEIKKELKEISDLKPIFIQLSIDKSQPEISEIKLSAPIEDSEKAVIIIVDDVLNSGKTIFYALRPFINLKVKKIETAFLVNRAHRSFPISASYTGIELATTIQERINFTRSEEGFGVYLE